MIGVFLNGREGRPADEGDARVGAKRRPAGPPTVRK
jgi:hypothetical protein